MSTPPDRLSNNKTQVAEALVSCVKTALQIPDLVAKDQGTSLTEVTDALIAREQIITSTCTHTEQQLGRAVDSYAKSLEAVAKPLRHLLGSAARLEAVLAVEEARTRRKLTQQQQQQQRPGA
ncbi:hypothetical protein Vretifemale_19992 [Volvox reticuliferus]|uniref:Uncharacterized protein n=1 Tax=Volvox reticuliferus TaxID=1737510 RepID=A0A8J4G161_9CHLO|nr:hypothetical protein Vretifemale_19992 [Volvox reticuliferus]